VLAFTPQLAGMQHAQNSVFNCSDKMGLSLLAAQ